MPWKVFRVRSAKGIFKAQLCNRNSTGHKHRTRYISILLQHNCIL